MNSVELHQVNAYCKFRAKCLEQLDECLEQLVESLLVRSSPYVFGREPGWPTDSFPRGNSHHRDAVSVFNPWDSEVPLPLADFNALGDESDLVSTLCNY
jgi:hypothetical protein